MNIWGRKKSRPRVNLDFAATTPMDPEVFKVLTDTLQQFQANPSGLHQESVAAAQVVQQARDEVARLLQARASEIIFTRGGTESVNMALIGTIKSFFSGQTCPVFVPHVITSTIEHAAVRNTLREMSQQGSIRLTEVAVNNEGVVRVKDIKEALTAETVLVSIMFVNNEIGSIQPIKEISKAVRHFKKHTLKNTNSVYPLMHTDAIQAANLYDVRPHTLGVDMLSLSGSKIYGPKNVGVLYIKGGAPVKSIMFGGDQENGMRPGTQDVAGAAAFARAFVRLTEIREQEKTRIEELKTDFITQMQSNASVVINGGCEGAAHIVNISLPDVSSERLIIELDSHGISASAKAACSNDIATNSHVLAALQNRNTENLLGSVRFSFGRSTTSRDIERVAQALVDIQAKVREESLI